MKLLTDQRFGYWQQLKSVLVEPKDGPAYYDVEVTPIPPVKHITITKLEMWKAAMLWAMPDWMLKDDS